MAPSPCLSPRRSQSEEGAELHPTGNEKHALGTNSGQIECADAIIGLPELGRRCFPPPGTRCGGKRFSVVEALTSQTHKQEGEIMNWKDRMTRDELDRIRSAKAERLVSLYLPTARAGRETLQGPIYLKNLLTQAEQELSELGLRWNEIEEVLGAARALLDDDHIWVHASDGFAIFLSPGQAEGYRLPVGFEEKCVVGTRFHIKPLLPYFAKDGAFYIITLSENLVQMYLATRHQIHTLEVPEMPTSMAEALAAHDPESQLQFHTSAGSGGAGGRAAMFFGTGDETGMDKQKKELREYFERVDRAVTRYANSAPLPLILGGVDYLLPIYRKTNEFPGLIDPQFEGNYDRSTPEEVLEKAWEQIAPVFAQSRKNAEAKFAELNGTGLASAALDEVVARSFEGRVDTLFVALDREVAGEFDTEQHAVQLGGSEDLTDLCAVQTLAQGGAVYALPAAEMPGRGELAAIYRY